MYRILLPSPTPLSLDTVQAAVELHADSTRLGTAALWHVPCPFTSNPEGKRPSVRVRLLADADVEQHESEPHFYKPPRVHSWVEVRSFVGMPDRQARLSVRLIALQLSKELGLAAVENRNGVLCVSPQAFVAWCGRQSHKGILSLGETDHVTAAPAARHGTSSVGTDTADSHTHTKPAALPAVSFCSRVWRRLCGQRTYVVQLPAEQTVRVARGLVREIERTFHDQNVTYEAEHHRVIIVARADRQTERVIHEFRRRVMPRRPRQISLRVAETMAG